MSKTVVLAHYYTTPDVQAMADRVGDSLDLAQFSMTTDADRIVFAGVKFMAETAKILNPDKEVILPHEGSTCSLVEMMDVARLKTTLTINKPRTVVTYINSSAEVKALSDYVVTSRNVEDIVTTLIRDGHEVLFIPDRNMGAYLAYQHPEWGHNFDYWTGAVCEVHDKFREDELEKAMRGWTDYGKYVIAHPEAPLPVLKQADYVGSTHGMLRWVETFPYKGGTIFVGTEDGLIHNMKALRPELDFRIIPTYTGCQCNACEYMKLNTPELVQSSIDGTGGIVIDYLSDETIQKAKRSINAMMQMTMRIGLQKMPS